MLKPKARWMQKDIDHEKVAQLSSEMKITPLVASLLVQRGLDTVDVAKEFLYTEEGFHDPYLMRDMEKAISRIKLAIEKKEKILVFGDYDAGATRF